MTRNVSYIYIYIYICIFTYYIYIRHLSRIRAPRLEMHRCDETLMAASKRAFRAATSGSEGGGGSTGKSTRPHMAASRAPASASSAKVVAPLAPPRRGLGAASAALGAASAALGAASHALPGFVAGQVSEYARQHGAARKTWAAATAPALTLGPGVVFAEASLARVSARTTRAAPAERAATRGGGASTVGTGSGVPGRGLAAAPPASPPGACRGSTDVAVGACTAGVGSGVSACRFAQCRKVGGTSPSPMFSLPLTTQSDIPGRAESIEEGARGWDDGHVRGARSERSGGRGRFPPTHMRARIAFLVKFGKSKIWAWQSRARA